MTQEQQQPKERELRALEDIIGLAFSHQDLPDNMKESLKIVDDLYHRMKDPRPHPAPQAPVGGTGCPYWNPERNLYPDDPGNHCMCKFSDIREAAARTAREQVLDKIQAKCTEEINHFVCDLGNSERMGSTKTAYRIRDYAESLRQQQGTHIQIRPEVMEFAEAMERALRKHDHKGGWENCDLAYLMRGIDREVVEARIAFVAADLPNVAEEVVDVANFCMMARCVARKGRKTDKRGLQRGV